MRQRRKGVARPSKERERNVSARLGGGEGKEGRRERERSGIQLVS
jgi:hypothetical protein